MALSRFSPLGAAIAILALSAPAYAHHSAAMFDPAKTVTISGAIKDYRWSNPHTIIEVAAMGDKNVEQVWSFEGSTPNILVRKGWSIHSFKPGDSVTVQAHPMRDGGQAGLVMSITNGSGAVLKDHDY
jgi:hypothetical protein